ncbi:MAG: 30S ribosomal protein S6 [Phycisphaera sp.]|nr:30S ribosomal protein S6 [Phycisphaera sp.]
MADNRPRLYEGMFLINPTAVNSSLTACTETVNEILTRANADIKSIHKWDDRKLAYPIKGQKRGIYMLAYFETAPDQLAHIERDVSLSDIVLRAMVLRAEHVGETELGLAAESQKETEAEAALIASGEAAAVASRTSTAVAEDDSDSDDGDDDSDDDSNE